MEGWDEQYLQGRTKWILTQKGAGSQKEKQAEGEEAADAGLAEQDFCQTSLVLMKWFLNFFNVPPSTVLYTLTHLNCNFPSAERPVVFRWRGHSSAEWGRDRKIQNWGKFDRKNIQNWSDFLCDTSVNFGCRPWLTVQELLRKYGFGSWTKPEEVWRGRNISKVSVIITTILLSKKWPYATKKGRSKATPICH